MSRSFRHSVVLLLATLLLCQSVASVADFHQVYSVFDTRVHDHSHSHEPLKFHECSDNLTDPLGEFDTALECQEHVADTSDGHDFTHSHFVYTAMAAHCPAVVVAVVASAQGYQFSLNHYPIPEPTSLLRPPCA